jgi:hypothetical protein
MAVMDKIAAVKDALSELEVCTDDDADDLIGAIEARGYMLVPKEPTDAQVTNALYWALEWMRQHKVDGLSPFKDYPPVKDTTRGMYRAMILAANQ